MRAYKLGYVASLFCLCGLANASQGQPNLREPTQPEAPLSLQQPPTPTTPSGAQPARPTTPPTGTPGTTARPPTPGQPTALAPHTTAQPQDMGRLAGLSESNPPEMFGDYLGRPSLRFFTIQLQSGQPGIRIPVVVPGGRSFKIAENESPMPMDRVYFSYNYYDDVFAAQNLRLGGIVHNMRLQRGGIGLEKTFCDGLLSFGVRQPLSSLDKDVNQPPFIDLPPGALAPLAGAESEFGDLSLILKVAPFINPCTGDTLSFGLAVTLPTGESEDPLHATSLQPFVAYIVNFGDWFIHGFTAVDFPTESDDATFLYNDIGLGYYLYRAADSCDCLTAVVPTIECHITTPLSERGGLELVPPPEFLRVGSSDVVDLTFGVNFLLWRSMRLGTGVVVPVTGPRPFDYEAMIQASLRF